MIWSTTRTRDPGRRVLLREAPGVVPRARCRWRWSRCSRSTTGGCATTRSFAYLATVRVADRGARAARLERQGPPGLVPAPRRVHAAAVGAGEVRDHRGAGRVLQPVPRRARRLASRHDPRPRRGAARAGDAPARPRHAHGAVRDHPRPPHGGGDHRPPAARARSAGAHRRLRDGDPRGAQGLPDRPVHRVRRPRSGTRSRAATTRSSPSRRSRTDASTGQGIGEGSSTQGNFVPEQHTDFIFTAVGEELGFVGAATLLALFAVVMWRTWRTARLSRDFFGTLVSRGRARRCSRSRCSRTSG